jgi:competence protein ComEC
MSFTLKKYNHIEQKKIIVYNVNKHTAIDFVNGNQNILLADTGLLKDKQTIDFSIRSNWNNTGITKTTDLAFAESTEFRNDNLLISKGFIQFYDVKMAVIDKAIYNPKKINVDYLLIKDNPEITIAELKSIFGFKKIIFDSTNKLYLLKKWIKECKESGINFYSLSSAGALEINI